MAKKNFKYHIRPAGVQAFQVTKESRKTSEEWPDWAQEASNKNPNEKGALVRSGKGADHGHGPISIMGDQEAQKVEDGDWIVSDGRGNIYSVKDEIFRAMYEENAEDKKPGED